MTIAQRAVDAAFRQFGTPASYCAAGGDPRPVTLIVRRPDVIVGISGAQIVSETLTLELRASEVANCVAGDGVLLGGETFTVQNPRRLDPDRLIWTIEGVPS